MEFVDMDKTHTTTCIEQFTLAFLTIERSFEMVMELLKNKEIMVVDYSNKEKRELSMEMRYDNAALVYLFDENNRCDSVFIFLDDASNLIHYVEYCSQTFQYNSSLKGWINGNILIQINIENSKCKLVILSIKYLI